MRTIKLTIEYEGTDFHGWQAQPGLRTVQGELESALRRMTGEDRCARAAGRTDAGVHAAGQVASFTTERTIPLDGFRKGLNAQTPYDISIRQAEEAAPGFDARFSAIGKHYQYRFLDSVSPSALRRRFTTWVGRRVDETKMAPAARYLEGTHDFRAFRAADDERDNAVRTISRVGVTREGHEIVCDVYGDGFLKNMVRIIAGTLMIVGVGRRPPDWVLEALESGERGRAGPTAPPQGLCLMEVFYPEGMVL